MDQFLQTLKTAGFKGDIRVDDETRALYSHDASLFEIKPQAVVSPLDASDVELLTRLVSDDKNHKDINLTARSGGTCMSGGSINESIIVDFATHMNNLKHVDESSATVEPGMYYRDFEKKTLEQGALMPSYPASRELCMIGGMIANNSGGEKSLEFGKP